MFSFVFVHTHRSTVFKGMSREQLEEEYIRRFFAYHTSANTPPEAYLTWKACQHTPSLMTNELLTGLNWDTITGLFNRVGTVKTMHVDTPTVTRSWAARADYDPFCPRGTILHNKALALFLSPNLNPLVENGTQGEADEHAPRPLEANSSIRLDHHYLQEPLAISTAALL